MDDLAMEHPELADYFDDGTGGGTLPLEVRAHVVRCRHCAAEMAALVKLRRHARELPAAVEPGRDLWTGIAARIASPTAADGKMESAGGGLQAPSKVVPLRRPRGGAARWREVWRGLAAAAVVLVVVTSGATIYLVRGIGGDAAQPTAGAADSAPGAVGLAAFAPAATEYRSTVEELEAALAARRDVLSPATVQIVEQNLLIIDNAISEARRALAADPTSAELPLLLSAVYRQKVELLREAVALAARS